MNAALFLGYTLAVGAGVIAAGFRWLPRRPAALLAAGLVAWFALVGWLSLSGMMADTTLRPPAILYMAVPFAALVILLAIGRPGAILAAALPLPVLIGAQSFRIGAEWLLHRLWQEGLIPRMLTWEGANFDILVGLTAPVAALVASRARMGLQLALAWNLAGLALLANVVVRAILSAPGPLNLLATDLPNRLPGLFPYTYLAGFLAPLALVLHVLALRALVSRLSSPSSASAR
ncbi:hypothetical protein WDZ92_31475 [Nostoc sp. NIES-2111]